MKSNIRIVLIFFPLVILFGLILGFFIFLIHINSLHLSKDAKSDAIAVLTGDRGRIELGIELLKNNPRTILLISGVYKKSNLKSIISRIEMQERVFIDRVSESTIDNAKQIVSWAHKNNLKEISIITSYYHMPRSIMLLKHFDKSILYHQYPVQSAYTKQLSFFFILKKKFFLYEEYIKFLLSLIIVNV